MDRPKYKKYWGVNGMPSDCAEAALFCAAFPTLYMTGSTLRIDGGGSLLL